MTRRIVIAGCRNYHNYEEAKQYLDRCLLDMRKENNIVIVSGGANGADALGERYAAENGFQVEKYPADWKTYGRAAGPKRNQQMAEIADCVICFWDGKSRGTKSMIDYAQQYGKSIWIKMISP